MQRDLCPRRVIKSLVNGKKAGMRENVGEVCVLRKAIYNYTGMLAPLYLRS